VRAPKRLTTLVMSRFGKPSGAQGLRAYTIGGKRRHAQKTETPLPWKAEISFERSSGRRPPRHQFISPLSVSLQFDWKGGESRIWHPASGIWMGGWVDLCHLWAVFSHLRSSALSAVSLPVGWGFVSLWLAHIRW